MSDPSQMVFFSSGAQAPSALTPTDRAAVAIELISQEFAADPSDETMYDAVQRHLTKDAAVDKIIYSYARSTLIAWRSNRIGR